jgi:hypothetical protein
MGSIRIRIPERCMGALAPLDGLLAADEHQIEVLLRHALRQIAERVSEIVDTSGMEDQELPELARRLDAIAVALDACEGRSPNELASGDELDEPEALGLRLDEPEALGLSRDSDDVLLNQREAGTGSQAFTQ